MAVEVRADAQVVPTVHITTVEAVVQAVQMVHIIMAAVVAPAVPMAHITTEVVVPDVDTVANIYVVDPAPPDVMIHVIMIVQQGVMVLAKQVANMINLAVFAIMVVMEVVSEGVLTLVVIHVKREVL